jgi:serine/threonine-protein kinase
MHMTLPLPDPNIVAPGRNIPQVLVDVLQKALEKDASQRYQSAHEFAEALHAALGALKAQAAAPALEGGAVVCNACRALVPRGQKFCGECGARAAAPSAITQPHVQRPSSSRRARVATSIGVPLPFVAREDDLAWIDACRIDTGSSLETVRIIGDPGVGKSRLLHEFLALAAAKGDVVIETEPDPYWAEISLFALRRAIVRLAGLPESGGGPEDWVAATPEARHGLSEIFDRAESGPSSTRKLWVKAAGGDLSPGDRRFVTAEALRWAIMRAHENGMRRRVILAIDDLHAVDGASRNAFADVIAEPPLVPMLLLATHAREFDAGWEGAWRILPGLMADVAASLVKGGAPPDDESGDDETRTIPPLYVDQLVRFSIEGGSDPPARMADLIALRIERLSQDARRTLQALAVVGDAADRPTLRRLLPDIADFERILRALDSAGMIEERESGAGRPGTQPRRIRMAHPLFRDITLATTPAAVRRHLHAKAAVDEDGDPLALPIEVQAMHAYHAQSAFEALMLLEQVADRAAARADQDGCVLALRRCVDLARRELFRGELDDPMRAVVIFSRKLGDALARAGNLTDADGVLREALDLAGPSGKDRALVLGSLAFVARERARASEASNYLHEALSLAKQSAASDLVMSLEKMRREWAQQA